MLYIVHQHPELMSKSEILLFCMYQIKHSLPKHYEYNNVNIYSSSRILNWISFKLYTIHLLGQVNEFTIISGRISHFIIYFSFLSYFCLLQGFVHRLPIVNGLVMALLDFFKKCLIIKSLVGFSILLLN